MKKGFTLVEMMVALMIFSIVAVVALTALVRIIDANKKAQTIQDVVVNMSFTLESMTRELRSGSSYYCEYPLGQNGMTVNSNMSSSVLACQAGVSGSPTSSSGAGIAFRSDQIISGQNGCRLIYAYEIVPNFSGGTFNGTFTFKKAAQTACNQNLTGSDFVPVIDTSSLSLTDYYFRIRNTPTPLFFLNLKGNSGTKENTKTFFSLQTAASPRIP